MPRMTYAEQLKHPYWQRRRLERLEVAGFACEHCASKEKTLHVHHPNYRKGAMAWEYEDHELVVFCESCHALWHEIRAELNAGIGAMTMTQLALINDLAFALVEQDIGADIKCPQAESVNDFIVGLSEERP